jgi:hypothetical protein
MMSDLERTVDETMSVAPPGDGERPRAGDAGRDTSIEERLQRDPTNVQAQLDRGSDESMDASDPPAASQPGHSLDPAPSSGFNEAAERARQEDS